VCDSCGGELVEIKEEKNKEEKKEKDKES